MMILFVILVIYIASDAMAKSFSLFPFYSSISKQYTSCLTPFGMEIKNVLPLQME